MQSKFLYAAYEWLLVSSFLHYGVDVISQYVRGKRTPGAETTRYYGLNTAYALGQLLVASVALFAIRHGTPMGSWPGLTIGFGAAAAWPLCANISETFPVDLIREQGGKEMNHERTSEWHCGYAGNC